MLALTVWQPWATLIIEGAKPFEFRRWCAPSRLVGERIAIHAGARRLRIDEVRALLLALNKPGGDGTALIEDRARPILEQLRTTIPAALVPHGSILGTAILGIPRLATEIAAELYGSIFVADSDRIDQHIWAWPMLSVERFDIPVPARGAQGFWLWSD